MAEPKDWGEQRGTCVGCQLARLVRAVLARKRGELVPIFLHLLCKVPLAQNSPYAKVTYFEVAYSATHHLFLNS